MTGFGRGYRAAISDVLALATTYHDELLNMAEDHHAMNPREPSTPPTPEEFSQAALTASFPLRANGVRLFADAVKRLEAPRTAAIDPVRSAAEKLSKPQRVALLWLPEDGSPREHVKSAPREVSFWAMQRITVGDPSKEIASLYSLCSRSDGERRPGRFWPAAMWSATPLGLAVRQAIIKDAET